MISKSALQAAACTFFAIAAGFFVSLAIAGHAHAAPRLLRLGNIGGWASCALGWAASIWAAGKKA